MCIQYDGKQKFFVTNRIQPYINFLAYYTKLHKTPSLYICRMFLWINSSFLSFQTKVITHDFCSTDHICHSSLRTLHYNATAGTQRARTTEAPARLVSFCTIIWKAWEPYLFASCTPSEHIVWLPHH